MDIMASARPGFRVSSAALTAILVTGLLLYLMQQLIAVTHPEVGGPVIRSIPPIVQVPAVIEVIKLVKPQPAPAPQVAPAVPPLAVEVPGVKGGGIPGEFFPAPEIAADPVSFGQAGGVVQQVMVPPQYPQRALARGVEGYVDVAFEVSAMGVPDHVRAVAAVPEGVFEGAAIAAVKRWKYMPRDAGAAAVSLRERIRFSIEQ